MIFLNIYLTNYKSIFIGSKPYSFSLGITNFTYILQMINIEHYKSEKRNDILNKLIKIIKLNNEEYMNLFQFLLIW